MEAVKLEFERSGLHLMHIKPKPEKAKDDQGRAPVQKPGNTAIGV
jgi:hypothetical protein